MALDLDLDLDLDLALDQPQDQSQDQSQEPLTGSKTGLSRISYLRYTGFKGLYLASNNLSLWRPRIG